MWSFLPMVENKTIGADSISARGTGAPAPRSTTFIIYYFLFIICNR